MFGSRKNKIREQINDAFAHINQHRTEFETHMSSVEEREGQIQEDVTQVLENTESMTAYAMQNVQEEAALLHEVDTFSEEFQIAMAEYLRITELVKENHDAVLDLVEENKHYTSPAKYLKGVPKVLKQEYQSYEKKTEELAESARQMSVQAVNAAVEAGRMGEAGKKFVRASEDLRQMALDHEKAALDMKDELQISKEKIQELEECILRLVALIKEGNVGTTRLMKKYMALHKAVEKSTMREFSEDVMIMRDKVVAIRNMDEEMVKISERNKIQLTDLQEELQTQKQDLRELESDLTYIFEGAMGKIC